MYTDSQRLGFKINSLDQRYNKKVQRSLAESRQSFSGVETPGWSSLMKSQLSDHTKKIQITERSQGLKEEGILSRLNKLGNIKWSEMDVKKGIIGQKMDKNETLDTYKTKPKGQFNSKNKDISRVQSASHLKSSTSRVKKEQKRWNQISVHEHLFLQSRKLENKRMIEKVLDDEFKKKQILKFHPTINPNSQRLAQIKFSRIQQNQQLEKQDSVNNQNTNTSDTKQKQCKQVERYRILNRTFYYLTQTNTILDRQAINTTIQQLPLPCIQCLQPIIETLYQGEQLEWVDFLQLFNDKKIQQKQSFFRIMEKWFARRDKMCEQ